MAPSHLITQLVCPGAGTLGTAGDEPTQIPEADAVAHPFIPSTHLSAVRISPHRILVTGGVTNDGRVLPLTVLRYFDLADSLAGRHAWAEPVNLRAGAESQASQKRRRKRTEGAYPVARSAHTLTKTPNGRLYLIGGLKVNGREVGDSCKSIFALDHATETWTSIDSPQASSKAKAERENFVGPRFAHIALYYGATPSARSGRSARARARSGFGSLLVHGGYISSNDARPISTVHAFDLKTERWFIVPARTGRAPALGYHAAVLLDEHFMVVHGGSCGKHQNEFDMTNETHVFDIRNHAWIQPLLHKDSDTPPAHRRLHCAGNGIGSHTGAGVFYGGVLENGQIADSLHSLRLVHDSGGIKALWREHKTSSSTLISEPSSNAVSSGAMVPCPELGHYFVIGGRGPNGCRKHPFAVAGNEGEHVVREARPPMGTSGSIPLRLRRRSSSSVPDTVESIVVVEPSIDLKEDRVQVTNTGREGFAKAKTSRLNRTSTSKRIKKSAISESDSLPLADDISVIQKSHKKIKSGLKRPRKTLGTKPPARTEIPAVAVAKVVHTESLHEDASQGEADEFFPEDQPAADVEPITWLRNQSRATKGSRGGPPSIPSNSLPDSSDLYTPTRPNAKKRRVDPSPRRAVNKDPIVVEDTDRHSDVEEVVPNFRESENEDESSMTGFFSADALAARGRTIARGKNQARARERGCGRAPNAYKRGTMLSRATVQAQSAEDETVAELKKRVRHLETEKKKAEHDLKMLNKDNRDQNEQMKVLLKEVSVLRNLRANGEKGVESGTASLPGGRSAVDIAADHAQSVLDRQYKAKTAMLESKVDDLQEELKEAMDENEKQKSTLDQLRRDVKANEDQFLLEKCIRKNTAKDYEFFRTKMNDYKEAVTVLTASYEKARQENADLRADVVDYQRQIQELKLAKSEAGNREEDGVVELAAKRKEVISLNASLADARQRIDGFAKLELDWKGQKASLEKRIEEAEKARQQKKSEADLLEDKNITLLGQLKSVECEHKDKVAECERMANEIKRAQEQSAKDRVQSAASVAEKSRLRTQWEKANRDLEGARRANDDMTNRFSSAVSKLLESVDGFSAEMKNLSFLPNEEKNPSVVIGAPASCTAAVPSARGQNVDTKERSSVEQQAICTNGSIAERRDVLVSSSEGTDGGDAEEDPEP